MTERMSRMAIIIALLAGALPLPSRAADSSDSSVAMTGRMQFLTDYALDRESIKEDPSLIARLKVDGQKAAWLFHAWIEGGWDGTMGDEEQGGTFVKRLDTVYQASTPYLDVKEFFIERDIIGVDGRIGVQRFSWGRLDEYPINDLFNPWDFRRFIVRPLEERKIGVPAVSLGTGSGDWTYQLVWAPWFVPYRLPEPGSRWSVAPAVSDSPDFSAMAIHPQEPDLPARTVANSALGLRFQQQADIDWAVNLFHGLDPRPVFTTTALTLTESEGDWVLDPGYVPAFHKITALGLDGATVAGDLSLRAEAAYTVNRVLNIRQELWGYPAEPTPGVTPLNPIEIERNTLDYGIAADYRPFEDGLLTVQAQQTVIFDRPDTLFERSLETLLWANLRIDWLNQKIETSLNLAFNPEHGANMLRAGVSYVLSDAWRAALNGLLLNGPPQSIFGRYAMNDQIGLELVYAW